MKNRKTLGFAADAAETFALTAADERAEARIVEACDWERDRKEQGGRIGAALRHLGEDDRAFARAVLKGRTWVEMGCPERTFYWRLKKIEKVFRLEKQG